MSSDHRYIHIQTPSVVDRNNSGKRKKGDQMKANEPYKFADGPLLQQILVQRDAMIPITTKMRVVTRNPMAIPSGLKSHDETRRNSEKKKSRIWIRSKSESPTERIAQFPYRRKLRRFDSRQWNRENSEAHRRDGPHHKIRKWRCSGCGEYQIFDDSCLEGTLSPSLPRSLAPSLPNIWSEDRIIRRRETDHKLGAPIQDMARNGSQKPDERVISGPWWASIFGLLLQRPINPSSVPLPFPRSKTRVVYGVGDGKGQGVFDRVILWDSYE